MLHSGKSRDPLKLMSPQLEIYSYTSDHGKNKNVIGRGWWEEVDLNDLNSPFLKDRSVII